MCRRACETFISDCEGTIPANAIPDCFEVNETTGIEVFPPENVVYDEFGGMSMASSHSSWLETKQMTQE